MRRLVLASPLDAWGDPAAVFARLYGAAHNAFWLDSGPDADTGVSFMGSSERVVTASVFDSFVEEQPSGRRHAGTVFDFLTAQLAEAGNRTRSEPEESAVALPFQLGWVGWLGYELHAQTMGVMPATAPRPTDPPDAAIMFVDRMIAFDHATRTVTVLALTDGLDPDGPDTDGPDTDGLDPDGWTGELAAWRGMVDDVICSRTGEPDARDEPVVATSKREQENGAAVARPAAVWADTDDEYLAMIGRCQDSIAAGDAYQLCLTTRATLDTRPDPLQTYLALRTSSPSHHGGLLRIGDTALLSASPEQFLSVSPAGVIESKPIKGTRRRGATGEEDDDLRRELAESDKERAENLMIVDLMRNDIGRVSAVGSVSVPMLLGVESYAHVHQLVSTVRGELAGGLTGMDAVAACFPAGSMTGAPKYTAVGILGRLEQRNRGIYSGAFGYFGLDGRIDLAMVIRSIVLGPHGATVGAGGGITAASVPAEELAEVKLKAAALLAVLGAGEDHPPHSR